MKPHPTKIGQIQLGTEVVVNSGGSFSGLLGASPGASVSVSIATEVIEKMYSQEMDRGWREKIQKMIPSYGKNLNDDEAFCREMEDLTAKVLEIDWTNEEDAYKPKRQDLVQPECTSNTDKSDEQKYNKLQANAAR